MSDIHMNERTKLLPDQIINFAPISSEQVCVSDGFQVCVRMSVAKEESIKESQR